MEQKFNILNHYKRPKIKLCKPDRKPIGYLKLVKDLQIKLVSNSISELSFTIYSKLDEVDTPYYDLIKFHKLIYADNFGYFIITNADIKIDENDVEYKTVSALASEYELTYSKLSYLKDTLLLYNPLNGNDTTTVLGKFIKANPLWKIGNVSNELWDIYRTYDESGTNWYNLLVTTVENNCNCIFKFDNVNRIVSAYTPEKYSKRTGVILSHKNLIIDLKVEEKADEVFTGISCFGGGNLDIARINPLGTTTIYNWSFFKTAEWMDKDTIDAVTVWETKFNKYKVQYITLLTNLRNEQISLIGKQTELVEIENKLKAVEIVIATKISQGISNNQSYYTLVEEKNTHNNQIAIKKTEISTLKDKLEKLKADALLINKDLSFETNFTHEQLLTLNSITKLDDYQNDSFIKTNIMNEVQIQDQSQALYDHCVKILNKVSQPRYYFKGQLVNFVFLKEFEEFTKQLELGCIIKARIKKGWYADLSLLSMTLNFDNPTDFPIEFSNRQRLDSGIFEFDDLDTKNSIASNKVNWDSAIWGEDQKSGQSNQIREFINGNFNAAKNALESAKGIGVTFDGSGLHLRKYIDDILQGNEIWATGDMIAMSSDNFNTPPKVAIGEFQLPNSLNKAFGVNAEFLAGYLVCGNNFVFENKNKDSNITQFRFDGDGAYLYNSKITIENDFSQIKLDPNNDSIFSISGRTSRELPWTPKIFMDSKGNANFVGKLTSEEGSIANWLIKKDGLYSPFGDYIKKDGNVKLGLLTLTPNSGSFNGNVYARNLLANKEYGWVGNQHINDNSISGTKLEVSYRDSVTTSISKIEVKADKNSSSIVNLTEYTNDEFRKTTQSIASVSQLANVNSASITSLTSYTNSEFIKTNTSIQQLSNSTSASIQSIAQWQDRTSRNITTIEQKADKNGASISLVVSGSSVNTASIVAAINSSGSSVTIKANKINFNGDATFVRPNDLGNSGSTTISGNRITTGTIDASRVSVTNLDASKITTGTLSAKRISTEYIKSYFSSTDTLIVRNELDVRRGALLVSAYSSEGQGTNIWVGSRRLYLRAASGIGWTGVFLGL